jgi:hypothetical protein
MPADPFPYGISPEPCHVLLIAVGTPDRLQSLKQALHVCGYAKLYEWSDPQPVPNESTKVMIALNRTIS